LSFGLLEGWWLFDDGRKHAVVREHEWERAFHAAGFGHVDWTDGNLPENDYQKIMIAMASGTQGPRLPIADADAPQGGVFAISKGDVAARTAVAEDLVSKHIHGWATPRLQALNTQREKEKAATAEPAPHRLGAVVLVTGATGSLGSHIVQKLAEDPSVSQVVCLNRRRAGSGGLKETHRHGIRDDVRVGCPRWFIPRLALAAPRAAIAPGRDTSAR
jgi:hypothetical protein